MSLEYSQEVTNDFERLLEADEGYDVIIYAGENENVEEIHAHSNVLRIRSQYFRTAFSDGLCEKKNGKFVLKKPNIPPQLFKMILRFIYCGKINLKNLQGHDVIKLLIAVDKIKIQTLINYIQKYFIRSQNGFLQQNPIEILETVYQHENFTNLLNLSIEKICEKPEILFNSDKFINLKSPLLELILKRDDLSLDEIIIWDNLIKWCLAQNSNILQDVTQWNKEEITIMERTILRFIPLIRFYHLSSEDFIDKVYPFKEIMPKDLVNNVLMFHMAPNKKPNINIQPPRKPKTTLLKIFERLRDESEHTFRTLERAFSPFFLYYFAFGLLVILSVILATISKHDCDSIIINNKHNAIFSSWIERRNDLYYDVRNTPYNFSLLYRASRDGNTAAAFHAKCDNKGATMVVIKIKNSEQIVGGYNPVHWESGKKHKSAYNFLFSFTNKNDLQSAKVGYSNVNRYSIGAYSAYGPVFGESDLYFYKGTWNSNPKTYPKIGIPTKFHAKDYEVFRVVKK